VQFRLLIEGDLRPRKGARLAAVHSKRQQIHPQMKRLWQHFPLSECKEWLRHSPPNAGDIAIYEDRAGRTYAPLVTQKAALHCAVEVLLLRPGPPGELVQDRGDIDNRLKTLFDALRVPTKSEIKDLSTLVANDENPSFCLLQDDGLITEVRVTTDRLLTSDQQSDSRAVLTVKLFASKLTWGNMSLVNG
jgi:hypothetical protein